LPEVFNAKGILVYEERFEVFDGPRDRQLAPSQARLTDSCHTMIGVHNHEEIVALAIVHGKGLDVGDLHDVAPSSSPVVGRLMPSR
jgi:hypothetical protein